LIALLALIWGGMSDGFGNPSLSLGERCDQIILSQILLSWAHQHSGQAFCSTALAHDVASFIKEIEVAIARGKPEDEVFLGQIGTDQIEEHFSKERGRFGSDANCTALQFVQRSWRISLADDILTELDLRIANARRSFTPAWDHLNPRDITGDSTVASVGSLRDRHNRCVLNAVRILTQLEFQTVIPSDAITAASLLESSLTPPPMHPLFHPPRVTITSRPSSFLAPGGKLLHSKGCQGLITQPSLQPPSSAELNDILSTVVDSPTLLELARRYAPSSSSQPCHGDELSFLARQTNTLLNISINPFAAKPSRDRLRRYQGLTSTGGGGLSSSVTASDLEGNDDDCLLKPGSVAATLVQLKSDLTLAVIRILDLSHDKSPLRRLALPIPSTSSVQIRAQILRLTPTVLSVPDPTLYETCYWTAGDSVEHFDRQNSAFTFDARLVTYIPSYLAKLPISANYPISSTDGNGIGLAHSHLDIVFKHLQDTLHTGSSPAAPPSLPRPTDYFPYYKQGQVGPCWILSSPVKKR
ncbi:hypothetical protein JCM1840_005185, partial [Sporobolomyces johnsonii]